MKKSSTHSFVLFLASLYVLYFSSVGDLGEMQKVKEKIIESESWRSTTGIVLSSGVIYKTEPYLIIFARHGYQPSIQYSYRVNNKKYIGHNHWHDNDTIYSISDSHIRSTLYNGMTIENYIALHYPVNRKVSVYYNPANPSESVLEISSYAAFNTYYYFALLTYSAAFIYILFYLAAMLIDHIDRRSKK